MFSWLKSATKIRDLREGDECAIQGRIVGTRELAVPGTQIKCVYFHRTIDKWERGARGSGRKMWFPVATDEKVEGFFLEDATGRVWIAAEPSSIAVRGGTEEVGPLGDRGTQRYVARVMRDGDVVRVRGVVSKSKAAEPGDVLVMRPSAKTKRLEITFRKRGKL